MSFIVFWNSSSLFPVGSSNPQSSLCLHETVGQFTLHPIVITISTGGISDNSFEYCVSSISIWYIPSLSELHPD